MSRKLARGGAPVTNQPWHMCLTSCPTATSIVSTHLVSLPVTSTSLVRPDGNERSAAAGVQLVGLTMDTLPVPSPTSGHDVPSPPVGEADGTSRSARATSPAIDLDAAVAHLNALAAGDALDTALATGRYLVDTFFDGDVCAFERPRAPGRISLRQLAGRSDLEASHCTLCRDIGILGQSLLLPRAGYPNLKLSHHCALLAVRDVASKLALARCSEANDWSSRQLAEEIGRAKAEASGPPRRGRPSVPKFVKAARQVAAMSRQITSIPCDEAALRRFTFSLSAEALETGRASAVELSVWFEVAAMRADELLVRLMQEDEAGEEGVAVDAAVEPRRAAAGELQRCNSPSARWDVAGHGANR